MTVANALQSYGKFKAYLGVGVAVFFALIMIVSAVFILRQPKYLETTGTIVSVSNTCTADVCKATVKFTAKGQEYINDFQLAKPKENTTISVFFTDESPPKFSTSAGPSKRFAYILIVVAILMVLLTGGIAYFVSTSKGGGAVFGGIQAAGNISNSGPSIQNLGAQPPPNLGIGNQQ